METVKIGNEDTLLRRFIIGHPNYMRPDGSVSSFAYEPSSRDTDGISVDLEKLTTLNDSVIDPRKFGLLRIAAGAVRSIPLLDCIHNPIHENIAHSLITGKITGSKKSSLIKASEIIVVKTD
jgi:hypothetical protein